MGNPVKKNIIVWRNKELEQQWKLSKTLLFSMTSSVVERGMTKNPAAKRRLLTFSVIGPYWYEGQDYN
jgi:hypothetical protein